MTNSIRKGKSFERQAAALLTQATGVAWHRVPCSGALSANNAQWSGDVYSTADKYKDVVVECKHYARLTINHLFLANSLFHKAVQQARTESKGQPWLLLIKSNNQGVLLVYESLHSVLLSEIIENVPQFALPMTIGLLNVIKVMTN